MNASMWFVLSPRALLSAMGLWRGRGCSAPAHNDDWRQARVDAVVCTRGSRHSIVHCLAALVGQTLRPRRVLLVDDGGAGRDHSAQMAREFASANGLELEVVVRQWSLGKSATLETQARVCDGEVLFVLDGDTVLDSPDYIERCVRGLYQGAGIASACGQMLPMLPAQRETVARTDAFRAWQAGDPYRDPTLPRDWSLRLGEWLGDAYRECMALYEQRFINRGQMQRLGGITHPLGGAVAYRRGYLRDLFERHEPIRGDDETRAEDVFIGLALADAGYRNIQVFDVTARRRGGSAHLLPSQAHRWATTLLQGGHFFDALLRAPVRRLRSAWRSPARLSGTGGPRPGRADRDLAEPIGASCPSPPAGYGLGLAALERIWIPVGAMALLVLGQGTVLAGMLVVESVLAVGLIAAQAPDQRTRMVAKGVLTTPMRYALMLTELGSSLHFLARGCVGRPRSAAIGAGAPRR